MAKKNKQNAEDGQVEQAQDAIEAPAPDTQELPPPPAEAPPAEPSTIDEQCTAVSAELAQVEQQENELAQRKAQLTRELDRLIEQSTQQAGPHANQVAIQDAIRRSTENRAARYDRTQELLEMGAAPGELAATIRSPLDVALASRVRQNRLTRVATPRSQ